MTFAADDGGAFPKIVDVLKGSAAGDAGIAVGEYLIQVGGVSVKNMTAEAVLGLIRGDIGSTVRVSVGESDGEVGKTVALTRR
jgi:C-terminal processing protease CtpA/Prc